MIFTREITLDTTYNEIKTINIKQYTKDSFLLHVNLTDRGEPFQADKNSLKCFFKMETPDKNEILTNAIINDDGSVDIPIPESACLTAGSAIAEIVFVTSEITSETDSIAEDGNVLSGDSATESVTDYGTHAQSGTVFATMNLNVNIVASAYNNSRITSSDDFDALHSALLVANKTYDYVMTSANASANAAKASEDKAAASERNTAASEHNAAASEHNAAASKDNAAHSALLAQSYAVGGTGLDGRENEDEDCAKKYCENAEKAKNNSANSALLAQSYAVGGSGTRPGEDEDCARHYYEKSQEIYDCFNQAGTVTGIKGNAESSFRTGNVNITPSNVGALPISGGTMKGNIIITDTAGIRFVTPDISGGAARGLDFFNKENTERWGGIGVLSGSGNEESIYIGAETNTPWNPADGLSITADSMKWKNSDVVTKSSKNGSDLNLLTETGFYEVYGSVQNRPTNDSYFSLIVSKTPGTSIHQLAFAANSNNIYMRSSRDYDGSAWNEWKQLSDKYSGGDQNIADGSCSAALGGGYNTASGDDSIILGGSYNTASGTGSSVLGGDSNTASGECSTVSGGKNNTASSYYSHAEGYNTKANEGYSHAEGGNTKANDSYSHAEGSNTTADNYASHVCGKFNKPMQSGGYQTSQTGDVFVIGNGTGSTELSNALRVTYLGEIKGTRAFQSSGADYAEFVKPWADGNPENADRVGYFVTAKDGLLHKADEGDYILGITSGNPSVIGNGDEDYYWKYERDEFNRIIMEDVPELVQKIEEITESVQVMGEDGSPLTDEDENPVTEEITRKIPVFDKETHEPVMIETGNIIKKARMKLAEDYDPSLQKNYVERKDRKEWDYVGMVGILPVRDDGTCLPGQFCKCGQGGIATLAGERGFDTFYVIERISDNIVSVELR